MNFPSNLTSLVAFLLSEAPSVNKKTVGGPQATAFSKSENKGSEFWGSQGAGVLIIAKDTGRLLVLLRSAEVNEPHTWGLAGGAIDAGEDPKVAALREVKEELGFAGAIKLVPAFVFRKGDFTFHNFLGVVPKEFKPRLDWENDDARWVSINKLPSPLHFGLAGLLKNSALEIKKIVLGAPSSRVPLAAKKRI